jgi:hypothetical protein
MAKATTTKAPAAAEPAPADPGRIVRWDVTVGAPFVSHNIAFLPGRRYRVRQRVYDDIKANCLTAARVPDHVP